MVTPREVLRVLRSAGFYVQHQTGSHTTLASSTQQPRDGAYPPLPTFVLMSIIRQAGLTRDEFLALRYE